VVSVDAADYFEHRSFLKGETAMPAKQIKRTTKAAVKKTTRSIGKPAAAKRTTKSARPGTKIAKKVTKAAKRVTKSVGSAVKKTAQATKRTTKRGTTTLRNRVRTRAASKPQAVVPALSPMAEMPVQEQACPAPAAETPMPPTMPTGPASVLPETQAMIIEE
jgi:hypothetical protein